MSYDKNHQEGDCDKCLKRVGKQALRPSPFLYMDKNDKVHPDVYRKDYKQYFLCLDCVA